jgi:putative MATE family efflux protein
MVKRLDLATEAIFPLILKMSWPSIIAMLAISIYNFIDTFWLARLSPQALAALTVCFPIQMLFAAIGVGTGVGAGSFSARMFGAGNISQAKHTAGQIFFLSFSSGLFIIIAVTFFQDPILILFGAFDEIIPLCRDYLGMIIFSAPFLIFSMMCNNLLRAEGRPLLSMVVVLISSLFSIVLAPLLIFGIGPLPHLGIRGAALAAVLAQFFASIFSVYFLQLKSSKYELKWRDLIPDWSIIKAIYATGLPSVMTNLMITVVLVVYNHVLSSFGTLAIGALGISLRVNGVVTMILFGIGFGVMPVIGFSHGARLHERLRQAVFVSVKASSYFALISSILLIVFARTIVGIFTTDEALIDISTTTLRIYVSVLVFSAPVIIYINMFIGLGKGLLAMLLLFFRDTVLLVPLIILLAKYFGLIGAWVALPIATVIAFVVIRHSARKELKRFASI